MNMTRVTFNILLSIMIALLAPAAGAESVASMKGLRVRVSPNKVMQSKAFTKGMGQRIALVNTSSYRTDVRPRTGEERNALSGSIEISRSTSLYDLKNGEKQDGIDYLISLAYALPVGSIATKLGYTQDLNDQSDEASTINDTNITYTHQSTTLIDNAMTVKISWAPTATVLIPLSKKTRDIEQLETALIAGAGLKILAGSDTVMNGAGLSLGLTLGQNFHKYETDKGGSILNRTSSNQTLAAFYSIADWTFTVSYTNMIRWPYAGDVHQSFQLSEDITYEFYKNWSASVGHTNQGNALKPNGYDSNLSLTNDETSMIYLGLAYGF